MIPMLNLSVQGHIAFCQFDIGKINAFTKADIESLNQIIASANGAFPTIRILVLESAKISPSGYKIFCAGANQKERVSWTQDQILSHLIFQRNVLHQLRESNLCVISWVDGLALGLGAEFCLASDHVLASPDATFGFPEKEWGIVPGAGGFAWAHGWAPHPDEAQTAIQQGLRFDRNLAFHLGLADILCDAREFSARTNQILENLLSLSPEEQSRLKKEYHEKIDYKKWFDLEHKTYADALTRKFSNTAAQHPCDGKNTTQIS